jgi:hypothetical protein
LEELKMSSILYYDAARPGPEYRHHYSGPEGRHAITGDDLRVIRDLGDASEVDVYLGKRGVIIANRFIAEGQSPIWD